MSSHSPAQSFLAAHCRHRDHDLQACNALLDLPSSSPPLDLIILPPWAWGHSICSKVQLEMYKCVVQCKISHGIDRVPPTKYKGWKATVRLPTYWASTTSIHMQVYDVATDRKTCVYYNRMFMHLLCSYCNQFSSLHAAETNKLKICMGI